MRSTLTNLSKNPPPPGVRVTESDLYSFLHLPSFVRPQQELKRLPQPIHKIPPSPPFLESKSPLKELHLRLANIPSLLYRVKVTESDLYSCLHLPSFTRLQQELSAAADASHPMWVFKGVVWTKAMRRLFTVVERALAHKVIYF